VRRRSPGRLGGGLDSVVRELAPPTILARVQQEWPGVGGDAIAAHAEPVAERDGAVTIACDSAVWAQEIELLAPRLLARLNRALAAVDGGLRVRALKASAQAPGSRSAHHLGARRAGRP
jgi:predicted nucleic acid-binding Zn ribbon protein